MEIQPDTRAAVTTSVDLAREDDFEYNQPLPAHICPSEPPVNTVLPPSITAQVPSRDNTSSTPLIKTTVPTLPFSRLLMAHVGAALALFLATTDATIVSTSLPTIISYFNASSSAYTWISVIYLLTQTALQPLYGRLSDILGRTTILYSSLATFTIGSLLCGAAPSILCLIVGRAIAGIGGGGIVNCVWVITTELVDVRQRAKWSQALSITWSASAIAGPVLGGLFSSKSSHGLSWRWAFYLNVPTGFVASVILFASLRDVHIKHFTGASWKELCGNFDFLGLFLFMFGTSAIIVGFSFPDEYGWSSPRTLCLIILGVVLLAFAAFYESKTRRDALFNPRIFCQPTVFIILIISFLHNFAFNAGTFYLALFYQAADGVSPLKAGILMLPYSLGGSLVSMPTAWFISFVQRRTRDTTGQKIATCLGLAIASIGFGLLILLQSGPSPLKILAPLIAGSGLGMLFHPPYQIFAKAIGPEQLATGTSAFFLVRFTGATVGLAAAGAVFDGVFNSRTSSYAGTGGQMVASADWSKIKMLQPLSLQQEVIQAVTAAMQHVWIVCLPCLALAFLLSVLIKRVPIEYIAGTSESSSTIESGHEKEEKAGV